MVSEDGGVKPAWQLFELANDYGQKNDVAAKHPEVLKELAINFDKWWDECLPLMIN